MVVSSKTLDQAKYIRRGDDDSQDIENLGQCGSTPCNYSKFIDNGSGEEQRYCVKLQMPVACYDSCKYHDDSDWRALMNQWQDVVVQENAAKSRAAQTSKKRNWLPVLVVLCVCAIVLFYFFK